MKTQKKNKKVDKKNKIQRTHTKQNKTKGKRESEKKKKVTLPTDPIFPKDFSHVVYLFLHQNLLSTIHLRY